MGTLALCLATQGSFDDARSARAEFLSLVNPKWSVRRRWRIAELDTNIGERLGETQGRAERARGVMSLAEAAGARRALAIWRVQLAEAHIAEGELTRARAVLHDCLDELSTLSMPTCELWGAILLCMIDLLEDDVSAAADWAARALDQGERINLPMAPMNHVAWLGAQRGAAESAARLLGATDAWYVSFEGKRDPANALAESRALALIVKALGPDASQRVRQEGISIGEFAALRLARAIIADVAPSRSGGT